LSLRTTPLLTIARGDGCPTGACRIPTRTWIYETPALPLMSHSDGACLQQAPQDWHVPAFINDKAWDFVGALSEHALLGALGAHSGLLAVPRPLYLSPLRRT
jgi:hypothetical protein